MTAPAETPLKPGSASHSPRPLAGTVRGPARWREAAAPVEAVRAFAVLVRPEVKPRIAPSLRLSQRSVQHFPADSLAPPPRDDEQVTEEASGGRGSCAAIATERSDRRHPDHRRSLVRNEKPRGGVAEVGLTRSTRTDRLGQTPSRRAKFDRSKTETAASTSASSPKRIPTATAQRYQPAAGGQNALNRRNSDCLFFSRPPCGRVVTRATASLHPRSALNPGRRRRSWHQRG
jgi:hypothetical protein